MKKKRHVKKKKKQQKTQKNKKTKKKKQKRLKQKKQQKQQKKLCLIKQKNVNKNLHFIVLKKNMKKCKKKK